MIPEYVRFYSGSVQSVLKMPARTFFAMINAMIRLKGNESLDRVYTTSAGFSGKDASEYIDGLKKQSRGLHGVVEEVRIIKGKKAL